MNKPNHEPKQPSPGKHNLWVALVALVVCLGLTVLLFVNAQHLSEFGLVGHAWYLVLFFAALAGSISLFYLFDNVAEYSGNAMNGKLKMSGPIVFCVVVMVMGMVFPPPSPDFDFTLYLRDKNGQLPLTGSGKVMLILGDEPKDGDIGKKGEVRFNNISSRFRGEPVPVTLLDSFPFQLPQAQQQVPLEGESATLVLEVAMVNISGEVFDENLRPIANAKVVLASHQTQTNSSGEFSLEVPGNMPEHMRQLVVTGGSPAKIWREEVVFGSSSIQIMLQ